MGSLRGLNTAAATKRVAQGLLLSQPLKPITELIRQGKACAVYFVADNGRFRAKEYFDSADKKDRARLHALVKIVSDAGKLASDGMGHWLKGKFKKVYEFKTKKCRCFALQRGPDYYLMNAADKAKPKKQEKDYERALELRERLVTQFDQGESDERGR
ncbi:MAG: hypothetical protein ACJ8AK_13785 [Gemmatimonadaceae bacterium]